MTYASTGLVQATDFNTLISDFGSQWSTGTSEHGLGQSALIPVSAGNTVTATQWTTLVTSINKCLNHQGQTPITPGSLSAGQIITYYNSISNGNALAFASSGTTGLALTDGSTNSSTYSSTWTNGSVAVSQSLTFGSANAARYFFNAGGIIKISISRSGGTGTPGDTQWNNLIAACGTINFGYKNTTKTGGSGTPSTLTNLGDGGAWNTSETDTLQFQQTDGLGNTVYIYSRWSGTVVNGGHPVLYITTKWESNGGISIDGNTITSIVVSSPSTTYLTNTWGTPTFAGSIVFTANTVGTVSLWGFGENGYGQLGLGNTPNKSSPTQVGTLLNWSSITSSLNNAHAVKGDGTLWAMGLNANGSLGTGNTTSRSSPTQVGALTTWSKTFDSLLAAGAIKTDGTLWTWGSNAFGTLGLNKSTSTYYLSPKQVGAASTWSDATASSYTVLALRTDGTLWSWGYNYFGQLGLGLGTSNTLYRSSPTQVGALTNWSTQSSQNDHSLFIKTDGTLWALGENYVGQLGLGDTVYRSSPTQVGALTTWSKVSSGANFTLAIKTNGTLWAWGYNYNGTLGLNNTDHKSSPTQVGALTNWSQVSAGAAQTVAIKTDGTLWAWGFGPDGTLGHNDIISRSSPVQVGALTWTAVSCSNSFTMGIKTGGTLWSWGKNNSGQLGQNNIISSSSPVQVGALTTWSKIASGDEMACAIKTDGTLWMWGKNDSGQLGQNNIISRSSPVQVGALTTWSNVYPFIGGFGASIFPVAAIKTDGTLWMWGNNSNAQLGLGDIANRSSPTQVGALTNWRNISFTYIIGGETTTFAIKTDNTLWSWGGSTTTPGLASASSPVQIGALTTWSKISSGSVHCLAIKTDGSLWGWGNNQYGSLGLGDLSSRSSPTQIGALTNWVQVSAGDNSSLAIKSDGTLWAWGLNLWGELGLGDAGVGTNRVSPTQVGVLTTWSKVRTGESSSVAIKTDGTLWTWGYGSIGDLGTSNIISRSSPVQVGALTTWSSIARSFAYSVFATQSSFSPGSVIYNSTASSPFSVPAGTTSLTIEVVGSGGGGGAGACGNPGSNGGDTMCNGMVAYGGGGGNGGGGPSEGGPGLGSPGGVGGSATGGTTNVSGTNGAAIGGFGGSTGGAMGTSVPGLSSSYGKGGVGGQNSASAGDGSGGAGGGGGGYAALTISSPSSSYSFTIGFPGTGGSGCATGTNGKVGSTGAVRFTWS